MIKFPFKKDISVKYLESYLINLGKSSMNLVNKSHINKLDNKIDGTALSQADLEVDKMICDALESLDSNIPIISEERNTVKELFMQENYWLIDPIDGTSNYISGGKEYTINIALIQNGEPTIGLIAHPPSKKIWIAIKNKLFLYDIIVDLKIDISQEHVKKECPGIIISRENNKKTQEFIKNIKNKKIIHVSSSLKFCYLVSKKAIIYPRFSNIKKWDIAAGHAILKASGGMLLKLDGKEFKYNYPSEFSKEFLASSLKNWRDIFQFIQPIDFLKM